MVCCFVPCVNWCKANCGDGGTEHKAGDIGLTTLIITEILRWVVIIIPIYLSVWRYAEIRGYTEFISGSQNVEAEFWGIITGIILGVSLFIYLPVKILAIRFRISRQSLKDHRWRPSIVLYMAVCAFPCLTLVLIAAKSPEGQDMVTLDPETAAVLQIMILGLTFTEWMSKLREEIVTYDLISAMAMDFFFAYDVIAFIMMCTYETNIFHSDWVYVCFVFAFVAMIKYIPTQPVSVYEHGAPKGAATVIIATVLCNDVPFVVVRISTMVIFGFEVSDLIHPIKNIGLICFGCTQLYMIYKSYKASTDDKGSVIPEKRVSRYPGVWDDDGAVSPAGTDTRTDSDLERETDISGSVGGDEMECRTVSTISNDVSEIEERP